MHPKKYIVARGEEYSFVPASHEAVDLPGAFKKVLFNSSDLPSGKLQMINWAKVPAGRSFQKHYHQDMCEAFIIISGLASMTVEGDEISLKSGDAILINAGSQHQMRALESEDVVYIVFGVSSEKNGKTIVCSP